MSEIIEQLEALKKLDAVNKKSETRTVYLNDNLRNLQFNYRTNYIRTTKFTKWSFAPLCLLQQFKRFANVYFLMIVII